MLLITSSRIIRRSSDLCPVYSPFFGAMVSTATCHSRSPHHSHSSREHLSDRDALQRSSSPVRRIGFCVHWSVSDWFVVTVNQASVLGGLPFRLIHPDDDHTLILPFTQLWNFKVWCKALRLLVRRWSKFLTFANDEKVGLAAMGVLRPDLMMKNIIPIVMAGIIAVSA